MKNNNLYNDKELFDDADFVSEGSTAVRVSQPGDGADPLVLPLNTKAPKNGYAYIYLSNENDDAVYFDNFTVSDTRGRIIEEDHYYPFGLKIAGISSVKLGDPNEGFLKNNNLYNDKELFDDADLDWYDYGFRNYDPQIGRFPQLDPLTDNYPELTNYQYASNDPILNIDLDGLEGVPTPGGWWNGSFLEQGGKIGSQAFIKLAPSLLGTALREGSTVADHKIVDALIKQALEGGEKEVENLAVSSVSSLLKKTGLLIYFTFKPVETGRELTPAQLYERLGYPKPQPSPKFDPPTNKPKDERIHEQYVLEAAEEGDFDVMERGHKEAQGKVHLKVGEVWKYGTTVNPEKRYTQKWLREKKLLKFRQYEGTRSEVLVKEKEKIREYLFKNGKLPPGNKQTN